MNKRVGFPGPESVLKARLCAINFIFSYSSDTRRDRERLVDKAQIIIIITAKIVTGRPTTATAHATSRHFRENCGQQKSTEIESRRTVYY